MNKVKNKGGGVIKHHKVYARKGDETLEFSSVPEAARELKILRDTLRKYNHLGDISWKII